MTRWEDAQQFRAEHAAALRALPDDCQVRIAGERRVLLALLDYLSEWDGRPFEASPEYLQEWRHNIGKVLVNLR